ncbi:acyltransferase [Mesorhizobium sp.]|uniref:acyltransferase n=1 Tax=Mesorhizobium sp. TaxID=1871066 RepID=UPI00121DA749|nr:acyltransferase [Mesorhizobium sp.]TIN80009.1 MAG: acyltransferase [Mesorhizobium sp.]
MIIRIGYLYNAISRFYWSLRARVQLCIRGVPFPKGFVVLGPLGLSARGQIFIGENVTIVNSSRFNRVGINHPTQLVAGDGATLTIGDNTGISGAAIFCSQSITIGNHVLIGANCRIYDTDFHPIDFMARREGRPCNTAPIVIEDDVWLGAGVAVLKGVTIGARSVIAAGSVVTKNIEPDTLAGGVPARAIGGVNAKQTNQPTV